MKQQSQADLFIFLCSLWFGKAASCAREARTSGELSSSAMRSASVTVTDTSGKAATGSEMK